MRIDRVLRDLDKMSGSFERDFLIEQRVREIREPKKAISDIHLECINYFVLQNRIANEIRKELGLDPNTSDITSEQIEEMRELVERLEGANIEQLQILYRDLLRAISIHRNFFNELKSDDG